MGLRTIAHDFEFASPILLAELIAFTKENAEGVRQFYVIGHKGNDLEKVRRMVSSGANAIECDILPTENPVEFVVNHDNDWGPPKRCDHPIPGMG